MAGRSKEFILNTLKGRIWLAVSALAVFNCVCGVIAYVASSFVTSDLSVPFFVTVLFSAVTTMIFGWWISNEAIRPVEKVSLLARSIERSPGMSLPKTTGSTETDELLFTLHRYSQQLQNLITLMDDVAAGKTSTALTPLENSDRLSASFQKLVSKVTDSIDAKKELDDLRTAVNQITNEVSGLQKGSLVEIRSEFAATKAISDALRMLLSRQKDLTRTIDVNSGDLKVLVLENQKRMRTAIEKDDARLRKIKSITDAAGAAPARAERISLAISSSLNSVDDSLGHFENGTRSAREITESVDALRKQIGAAVQKLQKVGDQSRALSHVSKSTQDLIRRSNMLSLNTTIYANAINGKGASSVLAEEIDSLSVRAEKVNKEISGIYESLLTDVSETQACLQGILPEIAKLSQHSIEGDDAIDKHRAFLTQLASLPAKIAADANEQSLAGQQLLKLLDECSANSHEISEELRSCEETIAKFAQPVEDLRDSITVAGRTKVKMADSTKVSTENGSLLSLPEGAHDAEFVKAQGEK